MADPSKLLRFYRSEWPVFVPRVADAADELRSAIRARDWGEALRASQQLGAIAEGVIGMARTVGGEERRPTPDELAAFERLSDHPLLDLRLPPEAWARVVDDYAFLTLAVGWSIPADAVTVAHCGQPLRWRALLEELEAPGRHPEFEEAEDYSGYTNLRQLAEHAWPSPTDLEMRVATLSEDARFVLSILGGLRRRSVEELRMAAHTVKLAEDRFVAALAELEDSGLAEYPASFRALALELSGADLKALAAEAGVKRTGTKAEILDRLLDDHAAEIAHAINTRGWYHPIAIGPISEEFVHLRRLGNLWASLSSFLEQGEDRDETDLNDGSTIVDDPITDAPPPRARWTVHLPTRVIASAAADGNIALLTEDGHVRQLTPDGEQAWQVNADGVKPDYSPGLIATDGGLLVTTSAGITLLDPTSGDERWSWRMGEEVTQEPLLADDLVFAVTANGLRAGRVGGREQWRFDRKRLGPPAVSADVVILTRAGEMLMALDVETGDLRWRRRIDEARTWAPAVSSGLVLLSGYQSGQWAHVALDASTGEEIWSHRSAEWVHVRSAPANVRRAVEAVEASDVGPGRWQTRDIIESFSRLLDLDAEGRRERRSVSPAEALCPPGWRLLGSVDDCHVIACRSTVSGVATGPMRLAARGPTAMALAADPPLLWSVDLEGHGPSSGQTMEAVDLGDTSVLVAAGLTVVALERASGAVRWKADVVAESLRCAGPLCFAMYNDSIKALDIDDGQLLWEVERGAEVVEVAFGTDRVLALSSDARLCALEAGTGRLLWEVQAGRRPEWRSADDEWAIGLRDGIVGWRLPDGSTQAADVATGEFTRAADVDFVAAGWDRRWLDPAEDEIWDAERESRDGRFTWRTSRPSWDAGHRGQLLLAGGSVIDVERGFDFGDAAVAADAIGVVILAERLRDYGQEDADDDVDVDDADDALLDSTAPNGLPRDLEVTIDHLRSELIPRDVAPGGSAPAPRDDEQAEAPNLRVWFFGR